MKFACKAGFTQRLFITLESKSVHLKPPGMLMVGQIVVLWQKNGNVAEGHSSWVPAAVF